MTRSDLTHLYFLLDRSGSMQSIKSDIEGGFAAFVEEQQRGVGECRATLAQFDDVYEVVYADRPIADVPSLDLQPRNMTALHDAMGRLITDAGQRLAAMKEDERPGTVIVAIMTDGMENASKEWTAASISSLVRQQSNVFGWTFMYMGADQDAIEVGESLGIARDHAVTYSRSKSAAAMATASGKIAKLREARVAAPAAQMEAFTDEERTALE
ncbi:MAG TPA: VWA domain-containing protein [Nocardioides sp.]|uniref:VWA domain-containing protein n=1 Tax=Nocardioides sp. TaxID=35761 RepID=UPI002E3550ED|nr:VWA domain-containing protein [Nocardioides sp.]HEX5086795.1 VWA domain-containing protein [Nocardioides sp.]